jgi:hypothetical protein
MIIANPIYDVVFKYLLSDNKIAKMLISAIIGEEVVDLEFRQTEYQTEIKSRNLLVYRLDFSAKIKQKDGSSKLILIEIQKAKFPSDIMRFRRYLGNQYADENNVIREKEAEYNAIPIVTIYFLGHKLDNTKAPVIKVQRKYIDLVTGKEIKEKEKFIESLTHDSFIIQIPYLAHKKKSDLEKILSIFDQSQAVENHHFISLDEENYPTKYKEVIRRLTRAASEPKIRATMTVEDDVISDLDSLEREIRLKEEKIKLKDKQINEKEGVIQEKEEVILEKEEVIQEKEEVIQEREKVIQEKERALVMETEKKKAILEKAYKVLISAGISPEEAKKQLNID